MASDVRLLASDLSEIIDWVRLGCLIGCSVTHLSFIDHYHVSSPISLKINK